MDRRGFLKATAAALAVIGFDAATRRWVTRAHAAENAPFDDAPALDGTLAFDGGSLDAASRDLGNMIVRRPCAVLRPGSAEDVQRMIVFCRQRGIEVAVRGEGHTTWGHTLADGGLVIENRSLATIHSIGPDGAEVDPGVTWRELLEASFAHGLTPPAITGYTKLSIAGTLSVGGVGAQTTNRAGMQMERVQWLDVVTGAGDLVRCSPNEEPELFEAVLGGLGQCGVIVRAKIDLVPVRERATVYNFNYPDTASFFRDFRTLLYRNEFDSVYNVWFPFGTNTLYQLTAVVFHDAGTEPDKAHLLRGLGVPPAAMTERRSTYLEYLFFVDDVFDAYFAVAGFERVVKPWFDVWLPESIVEPYIDAVVPKLDPQDVGPTGFVLILPQLRGSVTRPFFPVPDVPPGEMIYLFDILTSSVLPGDDPAFSRRMLRRNRRLYELARAGGGTRYAIGSLAFDPRDWRDHYGSAWRAFAARKRRYDPAGILNPGLGIFT